MNILVTGGAGFIGSHLVEALVKTNHQVMIVDNFNDFYDPAIKKANIHSVMLKPNCRLQKGDIRDETFLKDIFEQNHFDLVIHLAAMAGVRPSIEKPLLYSEVNIRGTQNLLEACRNNQIDKFILASSSSIYGNNPDLPFSESNKVDNPISPYAATKKAAELLCYTYHHLYNISMLCLRFFTVYGPRQRPDLAIHKFTALISEGKEILLYGDGNSARDYTYIDDIINGILSAIDYLKEHNCYEIINLGESKTISLNEMANELKKQINKKVNLRYISEQPGDVKITYADISKAKALLNYNPQVDFTRGIKIFLDWFNNNR